MVSLPHQSSSWSSSPDLFFPLYKLKKKKENNQSCEERIIYQGRSGAGCRLNKQRISPSMFLCPNSLHFGKKILLFCIYKMACQAGKASISLQTKIVFEVVGVLSGRETVYATTINSVFESFQPTNFRLYLSTIFISHNDTSQEMSHST